MTLMPPPPLAGDPAREPFGIRPRRTRARRAWALVGSIALVVLSALFALSAGGEHVEGSAPPIASLAGIGALVMVGASVLLVWRHRAPVLVAAILTGLTFLVPTTPLPALVALAAVVCARKGRLRWIFVAATYAATMIALCWDVTAPVSLLSAFAGNPAQGSPGRLALFWAVPLVAAVLVTPFAAFGIGRRLLSERDVARRDVATADRTVSALQREVGRQKERQELARELHDTLAADLSQVALHAGALELIVGEGDTRAVSAARVVRASSQRSLDDLRRVVKSLRDHDTAIGTESGLDDLPALVDDALRNGADVRAQIMVSDAGSCSGKTGHAAYRIVQEAISNVRRHAPGAALYLDVRGNPRDGLSIRTTNWLVPGAPPTSRGGGDGLTGMSERAQLAGGTFQGGVTPEGTFAITVWMPWMTPVTAAG